MRYISAMELLLFPLIDAFSRSFTSISFFMFIIVASILLYQNVRNKKLKKKKKRISNI